MKTYGPKEIRNIALIGHQSSGKTTLAQAILFATGALNRLERVDEGNSCLDWDQDEIDRKMTVNASVGWAEWRKQKVNFVDTPGYDDFAGEMVTALRITEGAVMLVRADGGVEVGTEKAWDAAVELDCPRLIFINRMDREHADYAGVVAQVQERLKGASAVPIQVPIGQGEGFRGYVDLIRMKAYAFDDKGVPEEIDVPGDLQSEVDELRGQLVEGAAEAREDLMEKYFAAGTLTNEELIKGLSEGVRAGALAPVLVGDAYGARGVHSLLDAVVDFLPSPDRRAVSVDGDEVAADPDGKPLALVFKNVSEPNLGDLYFLRIYAGSLAQGADLQNVTTDSGERLGQVYAATGKNREEVPGLGAGDIGMVMKLKNSRVGDTLTVKGGAALPELPLPKPTIDVAIHASTKGDDEKVSTGLSRLSREDPTFQVRFDPEVRQTILSVQGDTHLDVILNRLKRKYKVEVEIEKPRIPYKETIAKLIDTHYRHKKQTGGRGQFGEVYIKFEPLPRGEGFEFVDAITGGVIPGKFIPAVEKGVREAMTDGAVSGFPVVDIRATLHFGSFHNVDSDEHSFKLAGAMALKEGIRSAGPVMLEPIYNLTIKVPDENLGDIMGDISGRRGKIQGQEKIGRYQMLRASAPLAELHKYGTVLRSMSGGRATFSMEFSHYEELPNDLAQKVITAAQAKDD
ncbi:MAG: elongation factor G [Candidatus Krumholzibacteriota bacterium]|nr:elongation factor G [Candidatus Krumholzibacteriota bacterium]